MPSLFRFHPHPRKFKGRPSILDSLFRIGESGSSLRTEFLAGLATFLSMACIVLVNPAIVIPALLFGLEIAFLQERKTTKKVCFF